MGINGLFRRSGSHYGSQLMAQQRMMAAHAANKPSTTSQVIKYGGWGAMGTAVLTYGGLVIKHLATKDGVFKNIEKHYAHQGLTKDSGLWAKLTHSFGKAAEEFTLIPYSITKKIGEFFEKKPEGTGGTS